jgi:hypothetical protein
MRIYRCPQCGSRSLAPGVCMGERDPNHPRFHLFGYKREAERPTKRKENTDERSTDATPSTR